MFLDLLTNLVNWGAPHCKHVDEIPNIVGKFSVTISVSWWEWWEWAYDEALQLCKEAPKMIAKLDFNLVN